MKKILHAFSAGLDSTFLAWKILSQSTDELHLFFMDLSHIVYTNKDGQPARYYRDLLASEQIIMPHIIAWLSANVRPISSFEIVEGVKYLPEPADFPKGNATGWRVIPMLREAARIVSRDGLDGFVYGKSPENIRSPNQPARDGWYQQWWKENAPVGTTFETPQIAAWHGRPHALANLPAALQAIMLTCNDPRLVAGEPMACNVCDKCVLTAESRRLLALNVSPDDILDALLRRRHAGPYINSIAVPDKRLGGGLKPPPFPTYLKE